MKEGAKMFQGDYEGVQRRKGESVRKSALSVTWRFNEGNEKKSGDVARAYTNRA